MTLLLRHVSAGLASYVRGSIDHGGPRNKGRQSEDFLCDKPEHALKQTVELTVIWDFMMLT